MNYPLETGVGYAGDSNYANQSIQKSNAQRGQISSGNAIDAAPKQTTLVAGLIGAIAENNGDYLRLVSRIQGAIERIGGGWPEAAEKSNDGLNGSGGHVAEIDANLLVYYKLNNRLRDLVERLERIA